MRLEDLLARTDLGLVSLVAGSAGAGLRAVKGAHAIESPNPSRWVPADWVVLTTGMRLRDDPAARRGLVAELAERQVTALGLGVGMVFEEVPEEIVDEARLRGLPLFTVPVDIAFRDIIRAVDATILAGDLETYRRSTTITDALVQRLGGPDPESAIVKTLARMLGCGASLHDVDGNAEARSASHDEAVRRWRQFGRRPLGGPPVEVGADGLFVSAITAAGRTEAWLLVDVGRRSAAVPLIIRAVTTAARILQGLRTVRAQESATRRARRAEALRTALDPQATHATLAAALSEGLDLSVPGVVVVMLDPGADDEQRLAEALTRERLRHLVTRHDGALVAWVTGPFDPGIMPSGTKAIGLGRATEGHQGLLAAHQHARLAAAHAAHAGLRLASYADLPRLERLIATAGRDAVRETVGDVLDPLADKPHLLQTVTTWLSSSLSVRATAAALDLHENSVRHRLNRAASVLDRNLDDPSLIAELHLAILVEDEPRSRSQRS
jgi:purine catabolism regulator